MRRKSDKTLTGDIFMLYIFLSLYSQKRGTKILTSLSSSHFTGERTVPDFYKAKNATYGISMENNNQATLNQYLYFRMNKEVNK
jgi:hypothetical protein